MLLVVENDLTIRAEGDLTTTRVGRKRRRDQTNAIIFSQKCPFQVRTNLKPSDCAISMRRLAKPVCLMEEQKRSALNNSDWMT
ncbi:MAG: hypothetical protein ACJAU6_000047 [Alphaproteobacteria bacterium]|jgi:hypothetical protein